MKIGKKILQFLLLLIFIFIALLLYSKYINTKDLMVKEYKITNSIIPDNFHGLKLVQFSDIHYGTSINYNDLKKIVQKINTLKPDIVVFTGDLFDKSVTLSEKDLTNITKAFSSIEATIGKYAITGETDFSKKEFDTILTNSNFMNINDTFDWIYKDSYTPILITGLSSNLKNKQDIAAKLKASIDEINTYNNNHETPVYSILLMHEPDYVDKIEKNNYQLILAGHSLGGFLRVPGLQNLLLPEGSKTYYKDHYTLGNSEFYISNGIGTTSFTYRFFNKPSISLFRLTNQ